MNKQNFNQSEGFPLETEVLDDMQTAYSIFNSLGSIAGNYSIISGCEDTNGIVSNGVVFINGEVIEFRGGNATPTVIIIETPLKKEFENGEEKDVLFVRYATFGIGTTTYNWADFKRPKTTIQLTKDKAEQTEMEKLIQRVKQLEARPMANVPIGMIAIWGKPLAEIPKGWVEYEPLKGRIPVGLDVAPFDTLLGYGGSATKALTADENGPHDHKVGYFLNNYLGAGSGDQEPQITNYTDSHPAMATSASGKGKEFSIMNPYRVVHYIQYVGV